MFKCLNCGKEFEGNITLIRALAENPNKNTFCSRSCASTYTTTQWHKNKTQEEQNKINNKISNTLKNKSK